MTPIGIKTPFAFSMTLGADLSRTYLSTKANEFNESGIRTAQIKITRGFSLRNTPGLIPEAQSFLCGCLHVAESARFEQGSARKRWLAEGGRDPRDDCFFLRRVENALVVLIQVAEPEVH